MQSVIQEIEAKYRKPQLVDVRSGDTVRVHQRIKEGSKERVQVFEGVVIRTRRLDSLSAVATVRRIASGVGVEKTFMLHSPLVTKIEVVKRSKVRRNYLSYLRERSGKSARLTGLAFDKAAVNAANEAPTAEEVSTAPEDVEAEAPSEAPAEAVKPADKPE